VVDPWRILLGIGDVRVVRDRLLGVTGHEPRHQLDRSGHGCGRSCSHRPGSAMSRARLSRESGFGGTGPQISTTASGQAGCSSLSGRRCRSFPLLVTLTSRFLGTLALGLRIFQVPLSAVRPKEPGVVVVSLAMLED